MIGGQCIGGLSHTGEKILLLITIMSASVNDWWTLKYQSTS